MRPLLLVRAAVMVWLSVSCGAPQALGGSDEYMVSVWKSEQGVPPGFITGFAQSADGFLWMASDQGLARFDGVKFVSATEARFVDIGAKPTADTPGERDLRGPLRLFQSTEGSVWLSTGFGDLWRWNGREFESWFAAGPEAEPFAAIWEFDHGNVCVVATDGRIFSAAKPGGAVTVADLRISGKPLIGSIQRDALGRVWYLTSLGKLVEWETGGKTRCTELDARVVKSPTCLAIDAEGRLWLGSAHGLFVGDGTTFAPAPAPAPAFPVKAILPARDGSCWVAAGDSIWRWQKGVWSGPLCQCPPFLPPYACLVDHQSRLWLAPAGLGLWSIDAAGHRVVLDRADGLNADATALFCDREGGLWAAPYRAGVACVRPRRFVVTETLANSQVAPVWTICQAPDGAIWLGPEFAGASRLQGDAVESVSVWKDTFTGWPQVLATDRDGAVCTVAPRQGIFRFNGQTFEKMLPWPTTAGYCSALCQDRTGRWWLGSNLGLQSWQDGVWKSWGPAEGLPQPATHAIVEDTAGRLWIGTFGGGLARLDDDRFTVFRGRAELPSDSIYMLYPGQDGSLWIGTDGGLGRLRDGRFTRYTAADGLPENHIVQVVEDGLGNLWLGTRDGLCRVAIASLNELDRGGSARKLERLVFDAEDGIPSRTFQDRTGSSCLRGADGRLWFLTAAGAISCDPRAIVANAVAPSAVIEQVTVDGNSWTGQPASEKPGVLHKAEILPPAAIDLPPGPHVLELSYTAASLAAGEAAKFAYRLEGLDREWVEVGARRSALYSFLPPGRYRFRVRAANHDGVWNPAAAMIEIRVEPHIWERRLFQVGAALALASAIGGAVLLGSQHRHRRKVAQLELKQARESERTRIARDLHDDLGASLAEINLLATSGAGQPPSLAKAESRFQAMTGKTQAMVEALDAIVWAVDPKKDTVQGLASYLRSYVEDYFIASGVTIRIETPSELPAAALSAEARHHLYLAVKEAAHNVSAHAGATRAEFQIGLRDGALVLSLSDNGCGFDPAQAEFQPGNGLANMQARLHAIRGRVELVSRPGAGTGVTILYPLYIHLNGAAVIPL